MVLTAENGELVEDSPMTSHIADELVAIVDKAARQLHGIGPALVSHKPAADRWSIQEVVGHLVDSAANNQQRFIRAQHVDQFVFPKYEQNEWVMSQRYNETPWPELIELWKLYNRHLAHVIRNVPAEALSVQCRIGEGEPVTLRFIIEDYLRHLKHHLQKIAERVGPESTRDAS